MVFVRVTPECLLGATAYGVALGTFRSSTFSALPYKVEIVMPAPWAGKGQNVLFPQVLLVHAPDLTWTGFLREVLSELG